MKKLRKANSAFTMIELLAVIVILGLLMAIAIPSISKYMEKSRRSTLMASIKSYIEATTMEVNSGELRMYETNVIYAVPVECVALESGGENPFGEWSQSSDEYWAYVLVQYDSTTNHHVYGFTFKDSAGFGMYPTILNKISDSGKEVNLNLNVSRPKTGLYTYLTPKKEDWNGFKVNDNTRLKVFTSDDTEDSEYKCKIYKKGSNYDELKNKINTDFGILEKNDKTYVAKPNRCGSADDSTDGYESCYSGNNGQIEYDSYGGIVLDEDNPVVLINEEQSKKIGNEFSLNITVKGDASQNPQNLAGRTPGAYPGTIVAVADSDSGDYLTWVGFYSGYLHVYSYQGTFYSGHNYEEQKKGFMSIAMPSGERMYNIQITATKNSVVRVLVNYVDNSGNAKTIEKTATAGNSTINVKQTTIGDLRPYRKLKFIGTVYEIEIYNRIISDEEINHNLNRAKNVWKNLW